MKIETLFSYSRKHQLDNISRYLYAGKCFTSYLYQISHRICLFDKHFHECSPVFFYESGNSGEKIISNHRMYPLQSVYRSTRLSILIKYVTIGSVDGSNRTYICTVIKIHPIKATVIRYLRPRHIPQDPLFSEERFPCEFIFRIRTVVPYFGMDSYNHFFFYFTVFLYLFILSLCYDESGWSHIDLIIEFLEDFRNSPYSGICFHHFYNSFFFRRARSLKKTICSIEFLRSYESFLLVDFF